MDCGGKRIRNYMFITHQLIMKKYKVYLITPNASQYSAYRVFDVEAGTMIIKDGTYQFSTNGELKCSFPLAMSAVVVVE